MDVIVETGAKKTFVAALEWPGWCRAARDEASALEALLAYAPRYAAVMAFGGPSFRAPLDASAFRIAERLTGSASTDFGVPERAAAAESQPVDRRAMTRLERVLRACWSAFDATSDTARGRTLRTGPRGGGRDLEKIRFHVLEGESAYLKQLGGSVPKIDDDAGAALGRMHEAFVTALAERAAGAIPDHGPRGGVRWSPRYAARRAAWHVLDHAWEIEDRIS